LAPAADNYRWDAWMVVAVLMGSMKAGAMDHMMADERALR
jgi:hypothetical protein